MTTQLILMIGIPLTVGKKLMRVENLVEHIGTGKVLMENLENGIERGVKVVKNVAHIGMIPGTLENILHQTDNAYGDHTCLLN